jgi:uncharacterized protein (DUF1697 family)
VSGLVPALITERRAEARPSGIVDGMKGSANRYIALLRGINVGRAKRIAMADLRELLGELGYSDVVTLLNSGNAVFTATRAKPDALERKITSAIAERFGHDVSVIVRTPKELASVVANNPFPHRVSEGSKLHVSFLSDRPALATLRGVDPADFAPEEFVVAGREI